MRPVAQRRQYLMENPLEASRLEAKTDAEKVRHRLRLVGLGEGMRALDAGAGTGAVSRVMLELVGNKGEVVALDSSAERMRFGARRAGRVRFLVSDLYSPALRPASFDFVWCEFVFEYLRKPDAALAELVQLLRPGGKLVVADLDGNGVFHHPIAPRMEASLNKLVRALRGAFDPFAGRKLYHRFRRAGLESIRVHALPYHLYPGAAPPEAMQNWELKMQTLRPRGIRALGGRAQYDRFAREFLKLLRNQDALSYSVLFLVEGLRPSH